jgi:outer membrane protein OmpA-like peptidoglycan-associated protein
MHRWLCFVTCFALYFSTRAQYYWGIHASDYAGLTGVHLQPASIADSRLAAEIGLLGWDFSFANNYLAIDRYVMYNWDAFNDPDFKAKFIKEELNGKAKNIFFSNMVQPLSFMVTLSRNDAIAFVPRIRTMLNVDDIDEPLAHLIYTNLLDSAFWKRQISDDHVSIQANTWAEYGVTYARVLLDKNAHFLKAGVTAKLLQGLGSASVYMNNFEYNFTNDDTLSVFQTNVIYNHSDQFEFDLTTWKYKFRALPTVGFDFGIVYEWRPKYEKYQYEMDGQTGLWRRDMNKYKLRIGIALTDLGHIRYNTGTNSGIFYANIRDWDISQIDTLNTIEKIDRMINQTFGFTEKKGTYSQNLPTAFSTQIDYRFTEGLGVNFTAFWALKQGVKDVDKNHFFTNYVLTPRAENRWFGFYLPISYNQLTGFNMGYGIKLGPLVFGSQDFFGQLAFQDFFKGTNFYFMLKIPLFLGSPQDMDGDKVSDANDLCIDIPGVWEFRGCPDTDGDHVQDREDDCPLIAGKPEFRGCPDTDDDGIPDKEDRCPDIPGLKQFRGCPDTDSDGIPDREDKCPTLAGDPLHQGCPDRDGDDVIDPQDDCPDVPGKAQFRGCPDTDNDGVEDRMDLCPTIPGPPNKYGCPDSDGDGIYDHEDKCPTIPGPADNLGCPYTDTDGDGIRDRDDACPEIPGPPENRGCPYGDKDGDGIRDAEDGCPDLPGPAENKGCPYQDTDNDSTPDIFDKCPNTPGPRSNNGCPELKQEEKEILKKVFENLEFETGSAKIRPSSYPSLIELADLLKKNPSYKLKIEGHTDNVGSREFNYRLSQQRADAAKTFLVEQGVDPSRIATIGWGPDRPIAPNDTPEGRQKNRRVEFEIIFD